MRCFILGVTLSLCLSLQALAQRSPIVVELFTSQGCSSCPPADAMLHDLAAREDVIALALHVDYWDYIGWKDEFADPRNAERQRVYARRANRRSIYTPEFIVNGKTEIVGAKPMAVAKAISAYLAMPETVEVRMIRDGDQVQIEAKALVPLDYPLDIHLLRYQDSREARIARGENAGRSFTYANVTEKWQVLEPWDGVLPLKVSADVPGSLPVVVILQQANSGLILGAAQVR
ncbi:MAG: DUF1223 domain-containing protein [Pseudomonadota bacterium]